MQLQPAMFTAAFVRQVLEPLLSGQPAWLEGLLRGGIGLWSAAPALADGSAAAVQLAIGVLLLVWPERPPGRSGLVLAVLWSLVVWVWGEGLGMALVPGASLVTGAPGPVTVYAAAALWLLSRDARGWTARAFLAALWAGAGAVQLATPALWTGAGLAGLFSGAATPQPALLSDAVRGAAALARAHPAAVNAALGGGMLVAAAAWLPLGAAFGRIAFAAGIVLAGFIWIFGQDLGVLGGTGTDPNTALPLGVLGWAVWRECPPARRARSGSRAWDELPEV
ncbi:MAG: hypothetical protein M0Z27_08250 [Thermaerobacter sp.]|nr:hypothetical protein [Thermaerobacter sp.]